MPLNALEIFWLSDPQATFKLGKQRSRSRPDWRVRLRKFLKLRLQLLENLAKQGQVWLSEVK